MPELPDVEIFKREAEKALGSLVSGVDIHDSHFVDASKYAPDKEDPPKFAKCTIRLANDHHLHYVSKRKLGSFEITEDMGKYQEELALGPDALEIGEDEFRDKLSGSHAMLKNFLMDQSEISGIGNIYSDEILFQAGIHPEKKSSRLSGTQAKDLYKQTLKVLETAIKKEADIDKLPEDYLMPNREAGEKCPHCSGKIKKIKISGRTGYYCPRCQTKK